MMLMIYLRCLATPLGGGGRGLGFKGSKTVPGSEMATSWSPVRLGIEAWCLKFSSKAPAGN